MTASSTDFPFDSSIPVPFVAESSAGVAGTDLFESQWISEARDGSHEAFRLLVERHQDAVFRFCRHWLNCPEDAREVCQDTFLRAWDALPDYRPRARFSTWLFQIALNLCRDRVRSRGARNRKLTDSLSLFRRGDGQTRERHCPLPSPDEAVSLDEDLEKLRRGLAALPRRHSEVLILAVIEGLSQLECGEILGCSVRAVESRLYRARRDLMAWWEAHPG
ncbi:MAG: RNA polymerase sigma factor [Verrucomicrobiae bacterium]|nr:RNA polymerase sigma factor [Verrucomicrobiae bacterium]